MSDTKKSSLITKDQNQADRFRVEPIIAFYIFAAGNLLAALYAPIQDCDEVYNYWEPTHYLSHGYGLQTWEYSPEYSIRSWLYVSLHAIVGKLGFYLVNRKTFEFYFIRSVLGFVCAYCESKLFTTIARVLNPRVGIMFMIVMLASPGIFQASVAYLPSTFAMYCNMLGMSAFLDWRGVSKTETGIMWFGIGGLVGWPFSVAMVFPFLLEEAILAAITQDVIRWMQRIFKGAVRCVAVMLLQLAVESIFYRRPVIVPWNLVRYNLFSGKGRGPDIFGTEPADFYIRNLLLNFNVWMFLAILAAPLLMFQYFSSSRSTSRFALVKSFSFTMPFYMWLAIFTAQSHKEERFMYPMYPSLCLNAALALHALLGWFGNSDAKTLVGKIPPKIKLILISSSVLLAIEIGLLRTIGTITAYRAPLQIYSPLNDETTIRASDTVCIAKEWYRFPSSYFLPKGVHVKFVKSEFDGLLPGEFKEARTGFGFFPGTWMIPAGMNDQNIADPSKYTEITHCSYLVDLALPEDNGTALEPNYIADETAWERIRCEKFLDAAKTSLLGRLLWLPDSPALPEKFQRKWGTYCLLRRKPSSSA